MRPALRVESDFWYRYSAIYRQIISIHSTYPTLYRKEVSVNGEPKTIVLECVHCGNLTPFEKPLIQCPRCGENILKARYDLEMLRESGWINDVVRREPGLWRYHELLPLYHTENIVSLGEGWTPLLHARNLGKMIGLHNLYIKDERQGPTASF